MNTSKPAWITGASGLIGNYLIQTAPRFASDWEVTGIVRDGNMPSLPKNGRDAVSASQNSPALPRYLQLDLTNFDAVRQAFQEQRPQLIIHCAGLTRTAACQSNPELARRSNVDVTALLAELASDIQFIFFSTDLVFDGQSGNYDESASPNPIGVYAKTKFEAEQIVRTNSKHTIVRIALCAGTSLTGDRAFNEQMRIAWQAGKTLDLFTDEFRCPIHASVIAQAVWELANQRQTGIFHVAGSERLSRYEIGKLLAARWPRLNPKFIPASAKNYPGAPRCPDVSMNCAKVQKIFPLPRFSDWLAAHPNEMI